MLVATNLMIASIYKDLPLIIDAQPATQASLTPFALNTSLWDPKQVKLPLREPDQHEVSLKLDGDKHVSLYQIAYSTLC